MENYQPNETGEWVMETRGQEDKGDKGDKGTRGQRRIIEEVSPLSSDNGQYFGSLLLSETLRERLRSGQDAQYKSAMPKTQLLLHLIPIIGFFPSLWALYHRQGNREQLAISRLSITLALTWLLGYLLLSTGAASSNFLTLRLFILNTFLTSGYFLVSIWLILRLTKGKSGRLPGFSTLAERVVGKYLS